MNIINKKHNPLLSLVSNYCSFYLHFKSESVAQIFLYVTVCDKMIELWKLLIRNTVFQKHQRQNLQDFKTPEEEEV